jgi:inositol phosphorylceramide mannosyltransferase catalytic subunit
MVGVAGSSPVFRSILKLIDKMTIPKITHHIWIGHKPLGEIYKKLSASWVKFHPSWKHILWTDSHLPVLSERTLKILHNPECNIVIKTDLLRYEILYLYGGLYTDMDMECLKSFDILFESNDFICGIESNKEIIGSALIGCLPGHKAIQEMIEYIQNSLENKTPKNIKEHIEASGPYIIDMILRKHNITPMPQEYFYPIGWNEHNRYNELTLKEKFINSYTIHWWRGCVAGGWTKSY